MKVVDLQLRVPQLPAELKMPELDREGCSWEVGEHFTEFEFDSLQVHKFGICITFRINSIPLDPNTVSSNEVGREDVRELGRVIKRYNLGLSGQSMGKSSQPIYHSLHLE